MGTLKPRISVEYDQNATLIAFTDEKILDEQDIKAVESSIMSVIDQSGAINLVLDFSNVHFLSSAVLGLLIKISKRIYEADGRIMLCSINPNIHKIFEITRLTKVFQIFPDVKSALQSFSTGD